MASKAWVILRSIQCICYPQWKHIPSWLRLWLCLCHAMSVVTSTMQHYLVCILYMFAFCILWSDNLHRGCNTLAECMDEFTCSLSTECYQLHMVCLFLAKASQVKVRTCLSTRAVNRLESESRNLSFALPGHHC